MIIIIDYQVYPLEAKYINNYGMVLSYYVILVSLMVYTIHLVIISKSGFQNWKHFKYAWFILKKWVVLKQNRCTSFTIYLQF